MTLDGITPEKALAIMNLMAKKRLMFRFGQAARMLDMGTDPFTDGLRDGEFPTLVKPGTGAWEQKRVDAIPLLLLAVERHRASSSRPATRMKPNIGNKAGQL